MDVMCWLACIVVKISPNVLMHQRKFIQLGYMQRCLCMSAINQSSGGSWKHASMWLAECVCNVSMRVTLFAFSQFFSELSTLQFRSNLQAPRQSTVGNFIFRKVHIASNGNQIMPEWSQKSINSVLSKYWLYCWYQRLVFSERHGMLETLLWLHPPRHKYFCVLQITTKFLNWIRTIDKPRLNWRNSNRWQFVKGYLNCVWIHSHNTMGW